MGKLIDPVILRGTVSGRCPKCASAFTGRFDCDPEDNGRVLVELNCEACAHKGRYFYNWPDELPKVTLRHVSNGRALGDRKRRRKKRKINPLVLPGQMAFEGVLQ